MASWLLRKQFTFSKQRIVLSQLYDLVEAGVPASSALRYMLRQYEKNPVLGLVCNDMDANLRNGKKLSDNLEEWFPYEVVKILMIAEDKGMVENGLLHALSYYDTGQHILGSFTRMVPGLLYFIMILIFITVAGHFMLPLLGQQVHGQWPMASRSLKTVGDFFYHDSSIVLIMLVLLSIGCVYSLRHYQGYWYQQIARPFLRFYKRYNAFFLLQSLALLTSSAISVPEALSVLMMGRKSGFLYFHLQRMLQRITEGQQNMGAVINTGLLTRLEHDEMILIAEHVGEDRYTVIFQRIANATAKRLKRSILLFCQVTNILLYLITGLGVLWIYAGFALLASHVT